MLSQHGKVFDNTCKLIDLGPRLIVPILNNISLDIYAGYFILKDVNLYQDLLRSRFSIEAGLLSDFKTKNF